MQVCLHTNLRQKLLYLVPFKPSPAWLRVLFVIVFVVFAGSKDRAQAGDLYGLVIGIDDYIGRSNDLAGAVNDANDIFDTLQRAGAKKVLRFLDTEASKRNISRAWNQLVRRARKGDTIILTYSGHGSQEKEPEGRNGEEDGLNENFLLAKYRTRGRGTRERIVDDEIFQWLKRADDKGIRVIFVADSCHSGTMHRNLTTSRLRYRNGRFGALQNDELSYPDKSTAKLSLFDLKHATFVGATTDDRLTPEIAIDGEVRGALSWSFARAIEGAADKDGDGKVSQFELLDYIVPAVHAKVERQQTPQVQPLRAREVALFNVIGDVRQSVRIGQTLRRREARFDKLLVAVSGGDKRALSGLPTVEVIKEAEAAELVWDADTGLVEHIVGGVVAENVTAQNVAYVVNKWAVLKWLKSIIPVDPFTVALPKGNQRYKIGDQVEVLFSGARYPKLTLFNLPPDGRVEFFLPDPSRPADRRKDWSKFPYKDKFRVANPPFGAEHLVAIYSKEELSGLHSALRSMRTARQAQGLAQVLRRALKGRDYQIGVLDIYTGR